MKIGFAKVDITPRVGVELCGFGPFMNRHSIGVRDRLWARAMAIEAGGGKTVVVSCDLPNAWPSITAKVRRLVREAEGLPDEAVMVHCTHTHSGPNVVGHSGWGAPDEPYIELLPARIARACLDALGRLEPAEMCHALVPCEGIGLNREYDTDAPSLEDVLKDDWRPRKPELTDTTCHVVSFREGGGGLLGFFSYFGCHPVVCCAQTRYFHGDFCGVAMSMIEREHPGSVGLFLQGAEGDVNSCVVHKPEQEALLALDVIAGRFARSVRHGISSGGAIRIDRIITRRNEVVFTRKPWTLDELRKRLAGHEGVLHAPGASDADDKIRMAMVYAIALRKLIAMKENGQSLQLPTELHGIRLGPLLLLGTPFEVFQAIKNEVVAAAPGGTIPLVMSQTNDSLGYAVDRTAANGGYAAETVPLLFYSLPFADIHGELVTALKNLIKALNPVES